MGYDFRSPAAKMIFSLLPPLDADPSFLAVAAKGPEAVSDWCRSVVLRINNAIMNIGGQPFERRRFDVAMQTFRTAVGEYYVQSRKGLGVVNPEDRAEDVAKAGKELVDSCEELVAMHEKQIKEANRGPGLEDAFRAKVTEVRRHEASVWKACQGTAVVQEAEYNAKQWDAEFLRDIVAKEWEPVRPAQDDPVGPVGGAHRLPPLPPPPGPGGGEPGGGPGGEPGIGEPGIGEPGPIEPPREPGVVD